jgi:hypothetical protein
MKLLAKIMKEKIDLTHLMDNNGLRTNESSLSMI